MDAKAAAQKILDESMVGTMATVQGGKPFTRYMTFFNDGFTLYTATSKQTDKVDELEANPHTHILIGYEGEGFGDDYLEIMGTAEVTDDEGLIDKVWNEALEGYFDGPDDPNLVILKVQPDAMRVMNKKGQPPQDVSL
ncbi:General stress protein 26 [Bhargavaea cecembensis DSE10]|uniref:General stress protein 26 n=1 Tax=Bhargavaea cecembensis DSE10 TaxID=1235279 RepID=M7NKP3_9BACL|nr:pyridoxamine 5'-phosphate oxidase family protein [Bhargavaea cecembensis]EMR07757.1 General stress protein 26 [Bhargavaea cecembensis DSE10]